MYSIFYTQLTEKYNSHSEGQTSSGNHQFYNPLIFNVLTHPPTVRIGRVVSSQLTLLGALSKSSTPENPLLISDSRL